MTVEQIVEMMRKIAPFEQLVPALHDTSEEADFEAIAEALRHESEAVREHAMRALGDTQNPNCVVALSRFYRDPSEEVRRWAFIGVDSLYGDYGGSEETADVIYHDSSSAVRVAAVWALARVMEPETRALLGRALEMELPTEERDAVERALTSLPS